MIRRRSSAREAGELAGRAVGIQAVDALLDQPVDVAPQFRLVDLAVRLKRNDVRREDAVNLLGHAILLSSA